MAYFLVAGFSTGLLSFWLTGWVYRHNPRLRWGWFFLVRALMMAIAYLPFS